MLPKVEIAGIQPDSLVLSLVPEPLLYRYQCLPLAADGHRVVLGLVEPLDPFVYDDLQLITGLEFYPIQIFPGGGELPPWEALEVSDQSMYAVFTPHPEAARCLEEYLEKTREPAESEAIPQPSDSVVGQLLQREQWREAAGHLTDFDYLYHRLADGSERENRAIWNEMRRLLVPELETELAVLFESFVEFWRGRHPLFFGDHPEQVFLTLADHCASEHPVTMAARRWLNKTGHTGPWLRLGLTPDYPEHYPSIIELPSEVWGDPSLSPDGRRLLVVSRNSVHQVDPDSGEYRLVAKGSWDGSLRLGNTRYLVMKRGALTVYDLEGRESWTFSDAGLGGTRLAASADGRYLASANLKGSHWEGDPDVIRVWDLMEKIQIAEIQMAGVVRELSLSDDGSRLWAIHGKHRLKRWRRNLPEHSVSHEPTFVPMSPLWSNVEAPGPIRGICAERMMVSYEAQSSWQWGEIWVRDLKRDELYSLEQPPSKPVGCHRFVGPPDRPLVVTFNQEFTMGKGLTLRVWDLSGDRASLRNRWRLGCAGGLPGVSDDGTVVAYQEDEELGGVSRFSSEPMQDPLLGVHDSVITHMQISEDKRILASGSCDQTVCVFDLESGQCLGRFSGHGRWATPSLTADGRWTLVTSDAGTWLHDLVTGQMRDGCFALSRNGLVAALEAAGLTVYRAVNWQSLVRYEEHTEAVTAFAVSPYDPDLIASADEGGELRLWKLPNGETVKVLNSSLSVRSLIWMEPGRVLVNGDSSYSWWLKENRRGEVIWERSPPSWQSHNQSTSPGRTWEATLHPANPSHLALVQRETGRRLVWRVPRLSTELLFRGENEVLVGLGTGQIRLLRIES